MKESDSASAWCAKRRAGKPKGRPYSEPARGVGADDHTAGRLAHQPGLTSPITLAVRNDDTLLHSGGNLLLPLLDRLDLGFNQQIHHLFDDFLLSNPG